MQDAAAAANVGIAWSPLGTRAVVALPGDGGTNKLGSRAKRR